MSTAANLATIVGAIATLVIPILIYLLQKRDNHGNGSRQLPLESAAGVSSDFKPAPFTEDGFQKRQYLVTGGVHIAGAVLMYFAVAGLSHQWLPMPHVLLFLALGGWGAFNVYRGS